MKVIIAGLVTSLLLNAVAFAQTDSSSITKSALLLKNHRFNNPFYNLAESKQAPVVSFSFLRGSELHVSSHSAYRYTPYPTFIENQPLWKQIIGIAGQIAIQSYRDNYQILRFYPKQ